MPPQNFRCDECHVLQEKICIGFLDAMRYLSAGNAEIRPLDAIECYRTSPAFQGLEIIYGPAVPLSFKKVFQKLIDERQIMLDEKGLRLC